MSHESRGVPLEKIDIFHQETPDEVLWRQEFETWKMPEVTRLAMCNCPRCHKEVHFQSVLLTGGHLTSEVTKEKVIFFTSVAKLRRRPASKGAGIKK